jgi:hypothetical protein
MNGQSDELRNVSLKNFGHIDIGRNLLDSGATQENVEGVEDVAVWHRFIRLGTTIQVVDMRPSTALWKPAAI